MTVVQIRFRNNWCLHPAMIPAECRHHRLLAGRGGEESFKLISVDLQ